MLDYLSIKNFAIIDEQQLSFASGFNVLSGETGAGKSILIDALGLQLGDRADSSWVRHGQQRCDIQSAFTLPQSSPVFDWLKANEFDEDDTCQLRRTVTDNGKSKCYINGVPTTVGNTKALGEMLVDIHGQHAHQSLTNPEQQLTLLDNFAGHDKTRQAVRQAYQQWQSLCRQQRQLADDDSSLLDRHELLTYQLEEITALSVSEGEFDTLSQQQQRLSAASELLQHTQQMAQVISGDEMGGVSSSVHQLTHSAEQLMQLDTQAEGIYELFNQTAIYLQEAESALTHYAERIELDPQTLAETEQRMSSLHDLARKHRIEPDQLFELQRTLTTQLEELNHTLQQIGNIDTAIAEAEVTYQQYAKKLSDSRKTAAKRLTTEVQKRLSELNLENARFRIDFKDNDSTKASGIDQLVFMFSPNPGQGEKPLHKIASGGELSRISLAIQVAGVSNQSDATLIFDEVDSGVGGATAEVVGRLLKTLSQYNQVICVTHLAQVAAFADQHIRISKHVKADETYTHFTLLDEKARIDELARMSGGLHLDEKTQEHAQNMRQNAVQFSQTLTTTS